MKKKICLLLIFVISLFMFSGRADAAVSMYMKCNYADYCVSYDYGDLGNAGSFAEGWDIFWSATGEGIAQFFGATQFNYPDIDVFVPLTDGAGRSKVYGIDLSDEQTRVFNLEDEYENSDGSYGCWLKDSSGYNGKHACDSSIALDISPQTMIQTNTCPACIISQGGWNVMGMADSMNSLNIGYVAGQSLHDFLIDINWEYVPVSQGTVDTYSSIDKSEYIIYSYCSGDYSNGVCNGEEKIIAEGYIFENTESGYGAYSYVGPNVYAAFDDDIMAYQLGMIKKQGADYWKVHENFESLMITSKYIDISSDGLWDTKENVCQSGYNDCVNNHGYKVIIDSRDSNGNIKASVDSWLLGNNSKLSELSDLLTTFNNANLNNTSKSLNSNLMAGKSFSFTSSYSAEKFITDLEIAYSNLEKAYSTDFSFIDCGTGDRTLNASGAATSCLYTDIIGSQIKEIKDIAGSNKTNGRFYLNETYLVEAIVRDVKNALSNALKVSGDDNSLNILNASEKMGDMLTDYYTAVTYMDANNVGFGLTATQGVMVNDLRKKFEKLVEDNRLDIYPVVDCKGLIGEDLLNKINGYLDIIKIVIPFILIGFGVLDFTKAIFAGDDKDMKKAQQAFFKRIGIAVLIYLTPSLVNALLQLANKVWPIIEPSTCGIWE